jgi:mono/diheme cytochrome c family protein
MMDRVIRSAMVGRALGVFTAILLVSGSLVAVGDDDLLPGYTGKTLPAGWQTDSTMLAAGKDIYEGKLKPDVNCAKCHGGDGRPTRLGKGAPDLSDAKEGRTHTDGQWFWRLSEKKAGSTMPGYKDKLTEEQRWQVLAYLRILTQSGK